jgi:hypothetical protein
MLTSAGREAVGQVGDEFGSFNEFNEMLSVGYFEKSYMGVGFFKTLLSTGLCLP